MSDDLIHIIENCSEKLSVASIDSLEKYTSTKETKSIEVFIKKSNDLQNKASLQVLNPNKKYRVKDIEKRDYLFTNLNVSLNTIEINVSDLHLADIRGFYNSLISNVESTITDFVTGLITKIGNLASNVIASLVSIGNNLISSIKSQLTSIYNTAITSFNNALSFVKVKVSLNIKSLTDSYLKVKAIPNIPVPKLKDNYFKRDIGQSSLSKLTQANVKSVTGQVKKNLSVLKDTPAAKILSPKLRIDINKTISFKTNPIAKILGYTSSLIPTISTKKVAEPKPTDDKAEYGKIQVKENKAGFQEISDETPGNVRKVSMHPSGTYVSMLDNGDQISKTTGDKVDMNDGNWNIKTEKDRIEIISGDSKIEIRKGLIYNIGDNVNNNVGGDVNNVITGDFNDDVKGDYSAKINGDYSDNVGGTRTEKTGGDVIEKIGGSLKQTITNTMTVIVTGNINIISSGNTNITSSGTTNVTSGAMIKLTAPMIKLG